ncbi:hypothetical protein [Bradyrhizobium sp. WD16]|uniref:hypothetical protein n=1 Tax=Bradyrhizobium sp. WD16 TaxID=1521768 RepID=UPI0020A5DDBA|nr:hypothetical protein [Bradyrhizobium sp. WD16]UTD28511.1 hypothetical protein DB459_17995 [Bradyrhizobium sp. WD16]
MIRFALLVLAVLTTLAITATVHPADARSRRSHHATHDRRSTAERTAINEKPLKGASDDLDRTLNSRIKSICRGC